MTELHSKTQISHMSGHAIRIKLNSVVGTNENLHSPYRGASCSHTLGPVVWRTGACLALLYLTVCELWLMRHRSKFRKVLGKAFPPFPTNQGRGMFGHMHELHAYVKNMALVHNSIYGCEFNEKPVLTSEHTLCGMFPLEAGRWGEADEQYRCHLHAHFV